MSKLTRAEILLAEALQDDAVLDAALDDPAADEAAWQRVAARVAALAEGHLPANAPFPKALLRGHSLRRVAGAAVAGRPRALDAATLLVPPESPLWSIAVESELTDAYLYIYVRRTWVGPGAPQPGARVRVTFWFTVGDGTEERALDLGDDTEQQLIVPATFAVADPKVDADHV